MAYVCNWAQLNEEIQDINNTIGGRGRDSNDNRAVTLGLTANQALSAGVLGIAAMAWDKVVPKSPGGNVGLPDWLTSYGTSIEFAQAGLYLVSWAIDFTASGSTQDAAASYLSHFQASTGAYANTGIAVYSVEDTGLTVSLTYPATPFEIDEGDKIEVIVARVAGDSTAGWDARATGCFISIIKL